MVFKPNQKTFDGDLKTKSCAERLYPAKTTVKYLRVSFSKNFKSVLKYLTNKLTFLNPCPSMTYATLSFTKK